MMRETNLLTLFTMHGCTLWCTQLYFCNKYVASEISRWAKKKRSCDSGKPNRV